MAGLDPAILTCPESVHDIRLQGVPDEDRERGPGEGWQDYAYEPIPQTYAEWSYLGQAAEANFGFLSDIDMRWWPVTGSCPITGPFTIDGQLRYSAAC